MRASAQQVADVGGARSFALGRWVGWVVAGEGVGFLAPTAGFALTGALGLAPWAVWAAMILAGAVEGTLLGLGQAAGLRGTPAAVPRTPWVAVTAAGAAVAWSIGMLPTTLSDAGLATFDFGNARTWLAVAAGGLVLLATIPLAQWTVLRGVLERAWRWIPLNMAAWLAGLVFTFLPSPLIDERTPPVLVTAAFVGAGLAMAATVAVLTGLGLRRMLAAPPLA